MSVSRVAVITCDRCQLTAEMIPTNNAGRSVKPVDWAHLSMNNKPALDKPVDVIRTADLCPDCKEQTLHFIAAKDSVLVEGQA